MCRGFFCKGGVIIGLAQYNTTRLEATSGKLIKKLADRFCPNVQASTMRIIGLSQNGSENSEENLEGVFYPLAYKREYNQKIAQFCWRLCLALFCQSVKW